jgi:hypothetical protein
MDKQLANYFSDEASKAFAFLVNDHSFTPPQLQIDDKINFAFVIFLKKNLAIEFILDERESDITCKIARVFDGKKTPHYAVDENGVRVREGLFNLLRRRGIKERLTTGIGGLELHAQIKVKFSDFAQMLRKHGQDILNDSSTALD